METKLSKLKAAYVAGDTVGAMRIAAKFPQLGVQKEAILKAWNAIQNPDMYREMGHDVEAVFAAGIEALVEKYKL